MRGLITGLDMRPCPLYSIFKKLKSPKKDDFVTRSTHGRQAIGGSGRTFTYNALILGLVFLTTYHHKE